MVTVEKVKFVCVSKGYIPREKNRDINKLYNKLEPWGHLKQN